MRDVRSEKLPTDAQSNTSQIESKKVRNTFPGILRPLFMVLLLTGCQHTTDRDKKNIPSLPIITTRSDYGNPQWESNNWILFNHTPKDQNENMIADSVGIYLIKDGSGKMQLFHQGTDIGLFLWRPDVGKTIYTDSRAINECLWIMNSDGPGKRQLTFDE